MHCNIAPLSGKSEQLRGANKKKREMKKINLQKLSFSDRKKIN